MPVHVVDALVAEHCFGFVDVHAGQAGLAVARAVPSFVDVVAAVYHNAVSIEDDDFVFRNHAMYWYEDVVDAVAVGCECCGEYHNRCCHYGDCVSHYGGVKARIAGPYGKANVECAVEFVFVFGCGESVFYCAVAKIPDVLVRWRRFAEYAQELSFVYRVEVLLERSRRFGVSYDVFGCGGRCSAVAVQGEAVYSPGPEYVWLMVLA